MPGVNDILAATLWSATLIFTSAVSAMQISQFEKMAQVDKVGYEVSLLRGAIKALNDHGQPDQAQTLTTFFLDKSDNGGFGQLSKNLEILKAINKENAANPNNKEPVYEVEHTFAVTLKNDGINIPISVLLAINKDFKPSSQAAAAPSKQ